MAAASKKAPAQPPAANEQAGPDWFTKLRDAFTEERSRTWRENQDAYRERSDLARLVGHFFGGHLDFQLSHFAENLIQRCHTDHERALVLCILATWPGECDLQVEIEVGEDKKKFIHRLFRRHDEEVAFDGMSEGAVLRVQHKVGEHILAISIELTTYAAIHRSSEPLDYDEKPISLLCNLECGTRADFSRDVELRNKGYLIHRYTPEEILENPIRSAKEARRVLSQELDRRREDATLKSKQKFSRLTN